MVMGCVCTWPTKTPQSPSHKAVLSTSGITRSGRSAKSGRPSTFGVELRPGRALLRSGLGFWHMSEGFLLCRALLRSGLGFWHMSEGFLLCRALLRSGLGRPWQWPRPCELPCQEPPNYLGLLSHVTVKTTLTREAGMWSSDSAWAIILNPFYNLRVQCIK